MRDIKTSQQKLAQERIEILFREALTEYKNDPKLSHRYVFLARKLATRYNVSFTSAQRRQLCHKCYHFLLPGENCTVRTNPKTKAVEHTCKDCNHINRYGYSKEKQK